MSTIALPHPDNPEQFHEWTQKKLAEALDAGDAARTTVSRETWPEERKKRRAMIGDVLVPKWPKSELQVTITGQIERRFPPTGAAWTIRKLRLQSLPDYWVTANLYVPEPNGGLGPPYPGVIVANGHTLDAKAFSEYHSIAEELVRQGMVVLSFDPVSQGERVQRWDYLRNQFLVGWGTTEHDILGQKALLCGWPLAQAFVWDGTRAVDALLEQPEVDHRRIGMCGISGGGTQTSWLLAADDRLTAAAPACFITGWREQLKARVGADPEQFPYPANAWGWDQVDILASFAPKPLLLVAVTRDFFPIEGTRTTYRKLQEVYGRLGAPGDVKLFEADFDHSYYPPLREATVRFFCEMFAVPYDGQGVSRDVLPPEKLWVTATGQLATSDVDGRPVRTLHDWIVERKPSPRGARVTRTARTGPDTWQARRRRTLGALLGIPVDPPKADATLVDASMANGRSVERWFLAPEPGVIVPAALVRPTGPARGVAIYTHESGAEIGWRLAGGALDELVDSGWAVLSVDPRGVGAGAGKHEGEFARGYFGRFGVESHLTWTWTMMGRPLFGQRALDLLQAARWVRARQEFFGLSSGIIGAGVGAMWAMTAAALDPLIERVVAHAPLADYGSILKAHDHPWIVSALPPGLLTWGDLPHIAALVSPRELTLIAPVGPDRKPIRSTTLRRLYRPAREVYEAHVAGPRFRLVPSDDWAETVRVSYREWLAEGT